jgi:sugar phosphate isomerase/epimerase
MGRDPRTIVLNGWNQAWDVPNLYSFGRRLYGEHGARMPPRGGTDEAEGAVTGDGWAARRVGDSVSRREFFGLMGAFALTRSARGDGSDRGPLGSIESPSRRVAESPFSIGIQLYTLRELLSKDFEGTLAALAKIGYREVEFAGLYRRSAKEVRAILDRHGLQAPAGHAGIPQITDMIDQTIANAKTLGHEYVVVPWIPEESRTREGYRQMAEMFNRAAEQLHRMGLTLGYHNHWFEFDPISGGDSGAPSCGYDILLRYTDPKLVVMELDLYWVRKGGRDALQYFNDFKGRFRLVHVKDMATDGSMVDIGRGVIGWANLLTAAEKAGVQHFLAEHDDAKQPLVFARTSFDYLRTLHL